VRRVGWCSGNPDAEALVPKEWRDLIELVKNGYAPTDS